MENSTRQDLIDFYSEYQQYLYERADNLNLKTEELRHDFVKENLDLRGFMYFLKNHF